MKIHALIACHNRRDLTVQSVLGAQREADHAGIPITFTVYDDGSADGTSAAISGLPVKSTVIRGDGSAYWARSMAEAEAIVLGTVTEQDMEYVLWLNDDVVLDRSAMIRLATRARQHPDAVLVGAVRDADTGTVTYSGMRRAGLHPLAFRRVEPSAECQPIDTFNGNVVMIPFSIARRVGIDGRFSHGLADIDYGLRCRKLGLATLLAPDTYGTCSRNSPPLRRSVLEDWRSFTGPKGGGNYDSLRRILRKSNPLSWPFFVGASYSLWWVRRILSGVGPGIRRK